MSSIQEAAELPPLKPISSKPVLIAEPETISPEISPATVPADKKPSSRGSSSSKQHRTNVSKRLSGRAAPETPSPSLHSISNIGSVGSDTVLGSADHEYQFGLENPHHDGRGQDPARHILSQVAEWLDQEKTRKAAQKARRDGHAKLAHAAEVSRNLVDHFRSDASSASKERHVRQSSNVSEGTLALERLEQILSNSVGLGDGKNPIHAEDKKDSHLSRRRTKRQGSSRSLLRKASAVASSDTEYQEPDIDVPSAEVVLDNSNTLGYGGRQTSLEVDPVNPKKRAVKEREDWSQFKMEIVRLSHTLRLRGWRRIPLDRGGDIDVERLSGALTNAVYVVSPPKDLSQNISTARDSTTSLVLKRPPPKLLLRIYGPQVEHLIDRESELQILRRLARKKIGPRLLGTFTNGRFEQFFHARTLTARDLRVPETSKQIAKRMRELHDGIELLEEERQEGAFIWRNWNKWVEKCEEVISWLDDQILSTKRGNIAHSSGQWRERGLVCGVEWSFFRRTVEKYRKWLFDQYGGPASIKQKLVFAHNDTQYGNLLRLEPSGESPLLLPANEHKQLIVIDFEYASANLPGLEFANHFTEWCYDYHSSRPYALNAHRYPTPEEQHRFLKAYVQHRPPTQTRPSISPLPEASQGPSSSISTFMLDSRAPMAQIEEEKRQEEMVEREVKKLVRETRLWRIANSAQWVAWGIVQAKVPGMDEALEAQKCGTPKSEDTIIQAQEKHLGSDPSSPESREHVQNLREEGPEGREESPEEGHEEGEFDYLGYAQERAMFFWGDILQLGIVKEEDLPEELLQKVKIVKY
ncbi:kinase-like domain-containing protein [Usnea florida]